MANSKYCTLLSLLLLIATTVRGSQQQQHEEIVQEESSPPALRGLFGERRPRIINGDIVNDPGRYPYFALMNGMSLCGAVLISKRFVLTAAHCAGADDDFQIGVTTRPGAGSFGGGGSWGGSGGGGDSWLDDLFGGLFGSTNSAKASGRSAGIEYGYRRRVIHPRYDDDNVSNDIAIFELERDVPDNVQYARIRRAPVTQGGQSLTVIGFGDKDPSDYVTDTAENLRSANVRYVTDAQCRQSYNGAGSIGSIFGINFGGNAYIDDDMMCAFDERADSCGGDSGGPLLIKGATAADDELVGLVSWGVGCANGNYPGVYARISHQYDWIVDTMCTLNAAGVPDEISCASVGTGGGGTGSVSQVPPPAPTPVSPPTGGGSGFDVPDYDDDWDYSDFGDNDNWDNDNGDSSGDWLDEVFSWVNSLFDW